MAKQLLYMLAEVPRTPLESHVGIVALLGGSDDFPLPTVSFASWLERDGAYILFSSSVCILLQYLVAILNLRRRQFSRPCLSELKSFCGHRPFFILRTESPMNEQEGRTQWHR